MKFVDTFPCTVREIEHVWIPLADGCRLAARMWLPEGSGRVPAVIEYIPYGKRIGTRERDDGMHAWFAGHGIAAVRIDLRGSGDSEGLLHDEYLPLEQEDGVEAIAWVAAQPWCNGKVGMIGKSWGGFNGLQIAARRPPALGAVITVCSTDDRYADDVHTMGGCLLNDSLWWGAVFFQLVAQPPDPLLVGPGWRALWRARLEAAEPFPLRWMRHPLRDTYWKQGSVRENYGAIACPVYAVGGWADGYSNAVPRLVSSLTSPCRGLVGPWGHIYPHDGGPGPTIGFLQEAARWWRTWLADEGEAPEPESPYRVWMQESVPPGFDGDRPGRWISENSWPSPRIEGRTLVLAPGRLGQDTVPAQLAIASPQTTGRAAGGWLVAGLRDQSEDDAGSLCFDSAPLSERTEILGAPELHLVVASDRPIAFVVARLCDVAPDGSVTRVTYGMLNLTHRDGHESWQPLVPGEPIEVVVRLNDIAHAFPPGHRMRLALSNSYWPLVWPSPEPTTLTVFTEGSNLRLPVRSVDPEEAAPRAFEPPEQARAAGWVPITRSNPEHERKVDPATGDLVVRRRTGYDENGAVARARLEAADLEGGDGMEVETRIHPNDPLRARASMFQRTELRRNGWFVAIETEVRLSCTRDDFRVEARLAAWEDGDAVCERGWDERVPRLGL